MRLAPSVSRVATFDRCGPSKHPREEGFHSIFDQWVCELAHSEREVIDRSLAHAVKGKTEAAYNRAELLEPFIANDDSNFRAKSPRNCVDALAPFATI
jgi:hypothetical protein